jgi:hypothetical protein
LQEKGVPEAMCVTPGVGGFLLDTSSTAQAIGDLDYC